MTLRRRRAKAGQYVDPPVLPPPPVDRIIEEGVLISASAVKMSLKNRLIVAALRDHADFDETVLAEAAREDFLRLAAQSEETAERLERRRPPKPFGRESKVDAQRRKEHLRRPFVERELASALKAEADNAEAIARLVANARDDASDELRSEVVNRLVSSAIEPDPDYEEFKAGRIAYLINVDLAGLEHDQKS